MIPDSQTESDAVGPFLDDTDVTIHMPPALSDELLLEHLREFAEELGKRPTTREMDTEGPHSRDTYVSHFGSWNAALEAAGFDTSVRFSDMALINELQRLTEEYGEPPTPAEMNRNGEFNAGVYRDRFGSWEQACQETGVGSVQSTPPVEELLNELAFIGACLGRTPTVSEIDDLSKYPGRKVVDRFGGCDTATELAGLEPRNGIKFTDGELLDALREISERPEEPPTPTELNTKTPHSHNTYQDRFGSWAEALQAAGFEPRHKWGRVEIACTHCGETVLRKYSRAEERDRHFCDGYCFGEWWSDYSTGENNPRWSGGYEEYYGETWPEARSEALERDGHRCQACGISEEEHLETHEQELHVHHIRPIREFDSKAEANEPINLVTLCQRCHKRWEGVPVRPTAAD